MSCEHWRLTLAQVASSQFIDIMCAEEIGRQAIDHWKKYNQPGHDVGDPILVVEGYTDTSDRAEKTLMVDMRHVEIMILCKLY